MKKIIQEIRSQPHHVREIATILCSIVVVAVVVWIWFNSFQKNIYTLLNPDKSAPAEDQIFAQESKSLFGSILDTLNGGRAQISNLIKGQSQTDVTSGSASSPTPQASTHPLPVQSNR
jgi:hypothetical protein